MWAAARGQIEAVLGAPPRGTEHSSLSLQADDVVVVGGQFWCDPQWLVCSLFHSGTPNLASLLDELGMVLLQRRAQVSQVPFGGMSGQLVFPGVFFGDLGRT